MRQTNRNKASIIIYLGTSETGVSLCKVVLTFEVLCLVATSLFTPLIVKFFSSAARNSL